MSNPTPFVAINYITCRKEFQPEFEQMFATRAHAIDRLPGFLNMYVLKPVKDGEDYLIVSHWDNENSFQTWTKSPEFLEGHKRGFEAIRKAKESGQPAPMSSSFKIYNVISR